MPSSSDSNPTMPPQNGHLSPSEQNGSTPNDAASSSGSELSEVRDNIDLAVPPSKAEGVIEDAMQDIQVDMSDYVDEDAEGSADGDYDLETPPGDRASLAPDHSSSTDSTQSKKRKASIEANELIQKNPELYGLRRSGRARQNRQVIDSSDEEDGASRDHNPRSRKKRRTGPKASNQPTSASLTSESDAASDVYVGGRRNALTRKQRLHQLQVANGLAPPSKGEVRFSSRTANKITNYNVDDDDEDMEDELVITPNYTWEDNTPAIDVVLDHQLKEGKALNDADLTKHDFEYKIKWQGKAYYHATIETFESIAEKQARGLKRLDNYFVKHVETHILMSTSEDVPMEDKEQYFMDREKRLDANDEHNEIERIIDMHKGDDETEYLVKWKGVEYQYCTWEPSSLIVNEKLNAQDEIDRYLDRSSKLPVSDKSQSNKKTRRPYVPFKEQPDYIKHGQLREFQIKGVNFLAHQWCHGDNVILADEMGLGKTVQSVAFVNWLRHDRGQHGPFLVVVPLSTIPAWADTLKNWTPDVNYVVYLGRAPSREIIRDKEITAGGFSKKVKCNVLITSYEFVLSDVSFLTALPWQFLVVDEAHRLKNPDSQLYNKLMDFNIPNRLLITGTPLQNNLAELAALMNFLSPGKFKIDDNIDLQSETASEKIRELTEAIRPYMLRRTKQKVEKDLPPKTERIIRVELSDVQLEYYKNILTRNYAALNQGAKGPKQSLLNVMMELKKASNHPFMFPNAEDRILGDNPRREDTLKGLITSSGKLMLLDRFLVKLKAEGHRVLIFSQMVKMLDILQDYCRLRGYQYQRIDGTIPASTRRIAIDHFNAPDSEDFCFLLSTRAGGLGINLMTADTVILFDSDWNPQADLQAMARAHRIGQTKPVTVYRLVSKDTVEEEILERARNKLMLEFITIQRGVTDQDADSKLFADKDFSQRVARANKKLSEPSSSDDISRILKKRGQKMFEQTGNQKKLEELDIDAVLANAEEHKTEQPEGITTDGGEEFLRSFEYTDVKLDVEWDDIIPKDQLEAIKAEEKKKEEERYLAEVIEQNQPRKRKSAAIEEREQRAAKKRARVAAAADLAEDGSDDDSSPDEDPKRPLNEKELRNLIRAYERFGSFEEKADEIINDAKLSSRDRDLLKSTLDEVISHSQKLLKVEQDRVEKLEKETNKALTKKDRKAVLFDFKNVKRINAETIMERPAEMRMLRKVIETAPDWKNFRIPEAAKPTQYTAPWGAREDGMLCVGIARYGFGAWTQIRDDPELGLGDKFYLEEHRVEKKEERKTADDKKNIKSPGAVHLVRRANYLLSVLKDKTSNGTNITARRALENHHRNNKKWSKHGIRGDASSSISASPAPSAFSSKTKVRGELEQARRAITNATDHRQREGRPSDHRSEHRSSEYRHSSERRAPRSDRRGTPDIRRQHSGDKDGKLHRSKSDNRTHGYHRHDSNGSIKRVASNGSIKKPTSNIEDHVPKICAPIEKHLKRLLAAASGTLKEADEKGNQAQIIKTELVIVGDFIEGKCKEGGANLQNRFWGFVVDHYWPKKNVLPDTLRSMYLKIVAAKKQEGHPGQKAQDKGRPQVAAARA
ncbi:hypothetical protein NA57DRAFT_60243 [Rhizodiscina lignyota]|uniref:Uncharacterized protein n=1 Tax=Rhizodiscina lignyota TaxID=1504668 RepID=A0A9P4M2N6_9PEZI|nr:hypothetical protein NA57DRAFT_60243 [Rhizodiscina lignyota]